MELLTNVANEPAAASLQQRSQRRPRTFRLPTSQGGVRYLAAPRPIRRKATVGRQDVASPATVDDGPALDAGQDTVDDGAALDAGQDTVDDGGWLDAGQDTARASADPIPIRHDDGSIHWQSEALAASGPSSASQEVLGNSQQATPPESEYRNDKRLLKFSNALAKRQRLMVTDADPTPELLAKVRSDSDELFSLAAWKGMENETNVKATVKSWLDVIVKDERTHRELARDIHTDPRCCNPQAWHAATTRYSTVQGWYPECFQGMMDSNSGFLEHHETSLTHRVDVDHRVTPNKAVAMGMPPSARKTSLVEFSDNAVLDAEGSGLREQGCMVAEATKKGTETMLYVNKRALHSSGELANVVHVEGFSDAKSGSHFFSKTSLCTWVLAETIASATGTGQTLLAAATYSFASRLLGQNAVVEAFLAPQEQGLHKRYHANFVPDDWVPEAGSESLPCDDSKALIQDFHRWLALNVMPFRKLITLDGFALSVYDAAWCAVTEWLGEHPAVDKYWKIKLLFFRSDLLREARCVMRLCQHLTPGAPAVHGSSLRCQMNVEETIVGLWRWRRQVHVHHALYRYMANVKKALPSSTPSLTDLLSRGGANGCGSGAPQLPMSNDHVMQRAILQDSETVGVISCAGLRVKFKNRKQIAFQGNLAEKIVAAVQQLVSVGLLQVVPESVETSPAEGDVAAPLAVAEGAGSSTGSQASQAAPETALSSHSKQKKKAPITTRGKLPGGFMKVPVAEQTEEAAQHRQILKCNLECFPVS
jgi:hypothetical protein